MAPTKAGARRRLRLSERAIASSLGLGKGSVWSYAGLAAKAGLAWPLPEGLDDDGLELLLFPELSSVPDRDRPIPDWAVIDRELHRPEVTRMLLWEEYGAAHSDGFAYTWFCTHYDAWKGRVRPVMRQTHVGGEKVFVDFAGDKIDKSNATPLVTDRPLCPIWIQGTDCP